MPLTAHVRKSTLLRILPATVGLTCSMSYDNISTTFKRIIADGEGESEFKEEELMNAGG